VPLSALKKLLEALIGELEKKLPQKQVKTVAPVDPDKLKTVCYNLTLLLADDDSRACDLLDENTNLLNEAFPGHFRRISDGIQNFDFDAALAALTAATGVPTVETK
jgi:two-component system sensor histidine kinase/response regulator